MNTHNLALSTQHAAATQLPIGTSSLQFLLSTRGHHRALGFSPTLLSFFLNFCLGLLVLLNILVLCRRDTG